MKSTRKAFVFSLLSMLLCVSMLIGTTFAWFTDTATSSNNRIVAGNLDVDLVMHNGTEYVSIAGGSGDIFNTAAIAQNKPASLWEPGKTQVVYLGVQNKGNLAIKYNIILDVTDTDTTDGVNLADVLDFAIIDGATYGTTYANWAAVTNATSTTGVIGTLMGDSNPARITAASNGSLDEIRNGTQNETDYFVLAVHMQETAGNEYQGKEIVIDLSVVATQKDAEKDSFGPDYDANAEYPVVNIAKAKMTAPIDTTTTESLEIASSGEIKSASVPAAAANEVFNAMKDDEAESNELTLTLNVEKTGESTTATATTVALEIDMTAVMEKTKAGVTTTITNDVTTFSDFITIEYNLGTGLANVTATHKGNAMVNSTNTTDDEGNGVYSYDPTTGILTIKTKTLSPFAVSYVSEGQGTSVALTAENTETNGNYSFTSGDIILEAPINGGTAYVTIKDGTPLDPQATELKLTIVKAETTVMGRAATKYTVTVSGLETSNTGYKITSFPVAFDKDAGDSFIMTNAYNTVDLTNNVGSFITYENGAFNFSQVDWSNGFSFAVAYADPAEATMVDLKDIQTVLSVNGTTIEANDDNSKGDTVKSSGASITADGFTLKDLRVLADVKTTGGLYIEGNGTTIDNAVFDARWLNSYGNTLRTKGSNTTVKDTVITHYQTASSSSDGRYAGLELNNDTATSVTTIDNVTFKGISGLTFRSFAGRIEITDSTFDVSGSAVKLNVDSGPNTGSALIKDSTIKAQSIGFMRVKNITIENTSFETPTGTGRFTISTGDNVTTNITFKDCTFKNELTFPGSTTSGFKTVLTFDNCTYLGEEITADNIQNLFNFSVSSTLYHVEKAYSGTTLTITVAHN